MLIATRPTWYRTVVFGLSAATAALSVGICSMARAEPRDADGHWAFRRPIDPPVPAVKDATWATSPLDAFILAGLEQAGLKPAPPADRRTLIRRAYFDLIGLPPTPREVDEFVHDPAPDAFARVVDRLLANPHYGERWGRYWLDVARYADTKGYVGREEPRYPYAYTYRDYVIRSFNEDRPYDQFLIEQIAADRRPPGDDRSALAAMGFLTVGRRFVNVTHEIIADRIDVVARGTMGLTVGCARCHDHKYDPIPTEDYYALYSIFNNSCDADDPPQIGEPLDRAAYLVFQKELAARQRDLDAFLRGAEARLVAPLRSPKRIADYLMATRASHIDPQAYQAGVGPNAFVVDRWKDYLRRSEEKDDLVFRAWRVYSAIPEKDFTQAARAATAGLAARGAVRPVHPLVLAMFAGNPPTSLRQVAERYGDLLTSFDRPAKLPDESGEELRQVLRGEGSPTVVSADQIENLFLQDDRERFILLKGAVDAVNANSPGAPPRAMVLRDRARLETQHVFRRGNPSNPGKAVRPHFLTCLAGPEPRPFTDGSGRLELAEAIASADNPLTARVMANRLWLHHFGSGIVRTPSDFGTRGDPPTHPLLLDYLAVRLMRGGAGRSSVPWSIKNLHRVIMLSSTYQMSSDASAEAVARDPENRLLSHFNRRRLDFEAMRDTLLFVGGRLDPGMYGRSIDIEAEPFTRRRTVYAFVDRQYLPGLFRSFDFASPEASCPRRFTTTVPQQALFLMNSPFVQEQCAAMVERPEIAGAAGPLGRIDSLYRLLFGRAPSHEETTLGLDFLESEGRIGRAEASVPTRSLSPWERYVQVLVESNEFLFID